MVAHAGLVGVGGLEMSLAPAGSDYAYERLDLKARRWWALPHDHVISVDLFAGAIAGDAPFFEQYYVGDLTDFLPGRLLGLNFDRRPAPNFGHGDRRGALRGVRAEAQHRISHPDLPRPALGVCHRFFWQLRGFCAGEPARSHATRCQSIPGWRASRST